jgi:hypothetical protein
VIITDLGGQEYELTETRLSELPIVKYSRFVRLAKLQKYLSNHSRYTPVHYTGGRGEGVELLNLGKHYIGCRPFSPEDYALIIKAAEETE